MFSPDAGPTVVALLLALGGSLWLPTAAPLPSTGPPQGRSNQSPGLGDATEQARLQRHVGTLGLLFGAIEAEAAIERRLGRLLRELDDGRRPQDAGRKRRAIDGALERGRVALAVLGAGLDLSAGGPRSGPELRRELLQRAQEALAGRRTVTGRAGNGTAVRAIAPVREPVKRQVARQVEDMRRQLAPRIEGAVRQLERQPGGLTLTLTATLGTDAIARLLAQGLPTGVRFDDLVRNGLKTHIERIFRRRRQDNGDDDDDDEDEDGDRDQGAKVGKKSGERGTNEIAVSVDGVGAESEDEAESAESSEEAPGGLVGLIAGLSGGDEGSDVGALIGTLAAVVTNLFGPGGLDVPGLLGTGTSLVAGLLGGDDNFGKVLGSYVGIAIEGLSGGGADMNGAFFGNFLGAVIAALSSDPEDESLPLRPKLFVQNFFSGLQEAKRKDAPAEGAEQCCQQHGSDLFGFLGNIVSSVVGGITSLVLNASLGSSGGSSQGSADASGASSAGSSAGSDDHKPAGGH